MPREDFIMNVRTAAGQVAPTVWANGQQVDPDFLAGQLRKAALWLTPRYVEDFDPCDFADLPAQSREELVSVVERFRTVAAMVPSNTPPTREQFQEALTCLRRIVAIISESVRAEWVAAVERLMGDAESWSARKEWACRRVPKTLTEKFLGPYELPQLLIQSTQGRFLLDPIARYVPGASGIVDLYVMPSYNSVMIPRTPDGWQLHLNGKEARRLPWSEEAFVQVVQWLAQRA